MPRATPAPGGPLAGNSAVGQSTVQNPGKGRRHRDRPGRESSRAIASKLCRLSKVWPSSPHRFSIAAIGCFAAAAFWAAGNFNELFYRRTCLAVGRR